MNLNMKKKLCILLSIAMLFRQTAYASDHLLMEGAVQLAQEQMVQTVCLKPVYGETERMDGRRTGENETENEGTKTEGLDEKKTILTAVLLLLIILLVLSFIREISSSPQN